MREKNQSLNMIYSLLVFVKFLGKTYKFGINFDWYNVKMDNWQEIEFHFYWFVGWLIVDNNSQTIVFHTRLLIYRDRQSVERKKRQKNCSLCCCIICVAVRKRANMHCSCYCVVYSSNRQLERLINSLWKE